MADDDLAVHDPRADCREDLAQLGLGPDRSEGAGARTDDSHRLVPERVGGDRSGDPIEGVLQDTRDRRVVLGSGDQDCVRLADRPAECRGGSRRRLEVVVLVERRHILQAVVDDVLDLGRDHDVDAAPRRH